MQDLKLVYQAISKEATKKALMQLEEKWAYRMPLKNGLCLFGTGLELFRSWRCYLRED